jgi:hypothetical protein
MIVVEADARCGDAEHIGGTAIEVGIEFDLDVLRLAAVVAAAHRRLGEDTWRAPHPRTNPERVVVEQEADFHRVGRHGPFVRLRLNELRNGCGFEPGFVVEPPVEPNRPRRKTNRPRLLPSINRRFVCTKSCGCRTEAQEPKKRTSSEHR